MAAMDSPPVFKLPGKPLQQLSPERLNSTRPSASTSKTSKSSDHDSSTHSVPSSPTRRANLFADYDPNGTSKASGFALSDSPSLPEIHALRAHVRTNSDVQVLVKRFEHLDVRDRDAESSERRKKHEAELRRAQIAREEAETDVMRLREETRRLKKEGDEGRERERRLGKRLEVVMEEFGNAKENYTAQSGVYEKEVRRARKEAFKSSSAVVKLQEELKSTRNSLRITQTGFDLEKQKLQRREQETFSAQYQLVAVQEELDKLAAQFKTVQEERDALKTSLKEEEVARIAAEGMIALPTSQDQDDDLFSSPRKRSPSKHAPSPLSDDKENMQMTPRKTHESRRLEEQLRREQQRRERAEEMMDFLSLECQFQCCACRSAASHGQYQMFPIPAGIAMSLDAIREDMRAVLSQERIAVGNKLVDREPAQTAMDIDAEACDENAVHATPEDQIMEEMHAAVPHSMSEVIINDELPEAPQVPVTESAVEQEEQADTVLYTTAIDIQPPTSRPQTPAPMEASTPSRPPFSIRTVTTTTTIPMMFTPVSKPPFAPLPMPGEDSESNPPQSQTGAMTPTFDRAAALAAIQYRRGRAKSIAEGHVTPRKQMLEGLKERRDISAPTLGGKTGPPVIVKGAASAGRVGSKKRIV
nr:hypothetical protein CFP56_46705 [Quercus suber]